MTLIKVNMPVGYIGILDWLHDELCQEGRQRSIWAPSELNIERTSTISIDLLTSIRAVWDWVMRTLAHECPWC